MTADNVAANNAWPRVSVVIPALNEALNLPYVLTRIPSDAHEVILVDGFSVDDTVKIARQTRPDVRIVRQSRTGKGNALACGFEVATGEIIAMIDADGSADPLEIARFVEALDAGADFAKGSRFKAGGRSDDITRLRSLGNRLLTLFFNVCYSARYTDLCYGFNVFWRRHAPVMGLDAHSVAPADRTARLWGDGFEIETLIHIRVTKARLAVAEVASIEHARIHGVSNLRAFSDGLRVLATIVIERRYSRREAVSAVPIVPTVLTVPTVPTVHTVSRVWISAGDAPRPTASSASDASLPIMTVPSGHSPGDL